MNFFYKNINLIFCLITILLIGLFLFDYIFCELFVISIWLTLIFGTCSYKKKKMMDNIKELDLNLENIIVN